MVTPERLERITQVADRRSRFVTLVLDRVSDPHNLAAVVRSVDAFGFQEVHAIESGRTRIRLSRRVTRGSDRWVDLYIYPLRGCGDRALEEERIQDLPFAPAPTEAYLPS